MTLPRQPPPSPAPHWTTAQGGRAGKAEEQWRAALQRSAARLKSLRVGPVRRSLARTSEQLRGVMQLLQMAQGRF